MKTTLTLLVLALMMLTSQALAQEETAAQLWARLEVVSRDRVIAKHKALLDDPNGVFSDLLNIEADRASAANDPIFQTPDWPERIAERVYAKYQALPAVAATAAPAPQAQPTPQAPPAAVAPVALPRPAPTPLPAYKQVKKGGALGLIVGGVLITLGWAVYYSEREKKARQAGIEDPGTDRTTFCTHLICTIVGVIAVSIAINALLYDEMDVAQFSLLAFSVPPVFPVLLRLQNVGAPKWLAFVFAIPLICLVGWILLAFAPGKKRGLSPLQMAN